MFYFKKYKAVLIVILIFSCSINEDIVPSNNIFGDMRIIAHALGGIDNHDYLNVSEAMELHYNNGTRIFELDLNITADGYWIGLHKIRNYNKYTGSDYSVIPSLSELKSRLLLGKYEIKTFEEILNVFNSLSDSFLILDTKFWNWENYNDYNFIKSNFNSIISVINNVNPALSTRIIPQVFSSQFYNAVNDIGYFDYFLYAWVNDSSYQVVKNNSNIIAVSTEFNPDCKIIDLFNIYLYTDASIYYFTVNTESEMRNLILHGFADGFFSDYIYEGNILF